MDEGTFTPEMEDYKIFFQNNPGSIMALENIVLSRRNKYKDDEIEGLKKQLLKKG